MPPANTRFTPRACIESVICTALCHRILQLTDGQTASEKAILSTKLQKHRGEAIRQLTALLANSEEQTSDATLASVLTLLLAEIQQTFSPDWQRHSEGATAIIAMRGGLGELVFSRPWLRDLLRYYVMCVFHFLLSLFSPLASLPFFFFVFCPQAYMDAASRSSAPPPPPPSPFPPLSASST